MKLHNRQLFKALVLGFLIGGIFFMVLGRACHSNELEAAPLLICDTQQQAERIGFIIHDNDVPQAIRDINDAERSPHACASSDVVFLRGDLVGTVRVEENTYQIHKVMILGAVIAKGRVDWVTPNFQFSLEKVEERRA